MAAGAVLAAATGAAQATTLTRLGSVSGTVGPVTGQARTADGTLHVVFPSAASGTQGLTARTISPSGQIGTATTALDQSWGVSAPGLVALPGGGLDAVFGAIDVGPPEIDGAWAIASSDGGATWTAPALATNTADPLEAQAYGASVTAQLSGTTPVITLTVGGTIVVQQGLEPGSPTTRIDTTTDGWAGSVDSTVDAKTQAVVAGWQSLATGTGGDYLQQVAPAVGAPQKMPGQVRNQLTVAGRDQGPGVFAAYTADGSHVRLLRYDGGTIAVGATKAATPAVLVDEIPGNAGVGTGVYATRVHPILSAATKVQAVTSKQGVVIAHDVTVTVTDAGDVVPSATVTIGGQTKKTNAQGVAKAVLSGAGPAPATLTVTAPTYRTLTRKVPLGRSPGPGSSGASGPPGAPAPELQAKLAAQRPSPIGDNRPLVRRFATPSLVLLALVLLAVIASGAGAARAAAATWRRPPSRPAQWFWEIDPPHAGLAGLPTIGGMFPAPGAATIWDTDLFADSNVPDAIPTGPSPVVEVLHAAGIYSICYVEAGAFQAGFPDGSDFATADFGDRARRYAMRGWPGEWWFDLRGFRDYVPGHAGTLQGAAVNIAAGLARRIGWCALEGQDALEPDDLDGYTNRGATGVPGGGWHLTRADALGFERWLAFTAHADGLAIFQKNDAADAPIDARTFDGMIVEECNYYDDPCAGSGGDGTPYLQRDKPVLNAEYVEDGETTARFCPADVRAGITGALFNRDLDDRTYDPCPSSS